MRIGFSTRADHQIGMGHVFRCLRLREAFAKAWPGASFVFELLPGQEGFDAVKKRHPGEARVAGAGPWDLLVVDRLAVPAEEIRALKRGARVLLSLDDAGAGRWEADIAANALYAPTAPRPAGSRARSLDGLEYLCLDGAFAARPYQVREPARRLLVSQGGADTYGLVPRLLDALRPVLSRHPELSADVLVGPAFRHDSELAAAIMRSPREVRVQRGVEDMAALLSRMDLAVSGAGLTACELAAAGVPSVLVTGEAKELETAALLAARGAARDAGFFDEGAGARVEAAVDALAGSAAERARLSAAAQKAIDGRGLERLLDALRAALTGETS